MIVRCDQRRHRHRPRLTIQRPELDAIADGIAGALEEVLADPLAAPGSWRYRNVSRSRHCQQVTTPDDRRGLSLRYYE